MKEIKEYHKNGNLYHVTFIDEQKKIQGICKWYFYDQKINSITVFKNNIMNGVYEYFFNPDTEFLFHRREFIGIINNDVSNGIKIFFVY